MDVATDAPQGGAESSLLPPVPRDAPTFDTALDAARSLADARYKRDAEAARQQNPQAEPPVRAEPPQPESAQADASPPQEVTGETPEADQEEALPPIEPPKSWTKDEKERWSTFPREAQEALARIEQGREREFLRRQNEAAEKLKGLSTREQEVEKARQDYESKLPAIVQMLDSERAEKFPDIKTFDDYQRIANHALAVSETDPFLAQRLQNYLKAYDVHMQKAQYVKSELQQTEQRKAQETQKQAAERRVREHQLLIEKAPEFADSKKLAEAQADARKLFVEKGFTESDLAAIGDNPLLDDHRFQLIVNDAMKYREAQAKAKVVAAKPLPPAQRPGAAKADTGPAAQIQALEKQLATATGLQAIRIGSEITKLRRAG